MLNFILLSKEHRPVHVSFNLFSIFLSLQKSRLSLDKFQLIQSSILFHFLLSPELLQLLCINLLLPLSYLLVESNLCHHSVTCRARVLGIKSYVITLKRLLIYFGILVNRVVLMVTTRLTLAPIPRSHHDHGI